MGKLVLYNVHHDFSLKNLGKKSVHYTRQNMVIDDSLKSYQAEDIKGVKCKFLNCYPNLHGNPEIEMTNDVAEQHIYQGKTQCLCGSTTFFLLIGKFDQEATYTNKTVLNQYYFQDSYCKHVTISDKQRFSFKKSNFRL